MKKAILCLVLILAWCGSVYGFSGDGTGTDVDPYLVNSADLLNEVRDDLTAYYEQTADIDLGPDYTNWDPIAGGDTGTRFSGSYDGAGYKIENLAIDRPNTDNVGLFGHVGPPEDQEGGYQAIEIKNVRLEGVNVVGARGVGSLIGRVTGNLETLIDRCYAIGEAGNRTVTGDGATGGLVGSFNSWRAAPGDDVNLPIIRQSYAVIDVSSSGDGGKDKFGGLAGCGQKGRIENSFARGSVTVEDPDAERVGGLAGCNENNGIVIKSYSTGAVNVHADTDLVGGLLGNLQVTGAGVAGNVEDSFWDTETSGQDDSAGGTGKTTAEMKDIDTFTDTATDGLDEAWDFDTIWAIDDTETINDGYPYLQGTQEPLAIVLASFTAAIVGDCIEVEWETATEIDTIGFYLWRSDKSDSGYIQIDDSYTLSRSPMETIGARYAYTDCEVDINESARYYYELEELEMGETPASLFYGPIGPVSKNTETVSEQLLPASAKSSNSSGLACFIGTLKQY